MYVLYNSTFGEAGTLILHECLSSQQNHGVVDQEQLLSKSTKQLMSDGAMTCVSGWGSVRQRRAAEAGLHLFPSRAKAARSFPSNPPTARYPAKI
jgi:hypothetical protein